MPSNNPVLAFTVSTKTLDKLEQYWRADRRFKNRSDAARALLEECLEHRLAEASQKPQE